MVFLVEEVEAMFAKTDKWGRGVSDQAQVVVEQECTWGNRFGIEGANLAYAL